MLVSKTMPLKLYPTGKVRSHTNGINPWQQYKSTQNGVLFGLAHFNVSSGNAESFLCEVR